jgi:Cft2 family RNA processing exonuclease
MSDKQPTVGEVIKTYMALRDKKAELEAEVKEQVAEVKEKMTKLESYLKIKMDETGLNSFKSEHGTAFLTTTDYANVADWDEVVQFIKDNDAYDLFEKRVSKMAVRGYIDQNKTVPPGINYGTKLGVNIRKPTAKGD